MSHEAKENSRVSVINDVAVGRRLKEARLEAGFKLEEVAGIADLDVGSVSRYERGERFPKVKALVGLSETYNRSLEWILFGTEATNNILESKLKIIREAKQKYRTPRKGFKSVTVNFPMGGISEGLPDEVVATQETVEVIAAAIRLAARPRPQKRNTND